MATDITSLSISVKSEGIKEASSALGGLSTSSGNAEKRVTSLVAAMERLNAITKVSSVAADTFVTKMREQAALMQGLSTNSRGAATGTQQLASAMTLLATAMSAAKAQTVSADVAQRKHTAGMRDAHDVARGLSGSLGALWLTYGNFAAMGLGIGIGASLKGVLTVGKEVEHTLESLRVKGGETVESANQMREAILSIGKGIYGPQEVTKALEVLILAGLNAKDAMEALRPALNLATAGGTGIEKAAEALVTIGTAVGATAESYTYLADGITTAANVSLSSVDSIANTVKRASVVNKLYGASFEDILLQAAALSNLGIKDSAAGTAITNMMSDMQGKTEKAKAALNELGMSFSDATGRAKPLVEAYTEFSNALNTKTPETQKQYIMDIFGERALRDVTAIVDMVRTAADDTGKYANKLEELQAKISGMAGASTIAAAQISLTTENQLKSMGNTLKTTFSEVFLEVQPQVNVFAMKMKEAFISPEFSTAIRTMATAVGELAVGVASNLPFIVTLVEGFLAFKVVTVSMALTSTLVTPLMAAATAMGAVTVATNGATVATGIFGRAISFIPGIGIALGIATAALILYNFHAGKSKNQAIETAEAYRTNYLKALEDEAKAIKKTTDNIAAGQPVMEARINSVKQLALETARMNNVSAVSAAKKDLQGEKDKITSTYGAEYLRLAQKNNKLPASIVALSAEVEKQEKASAAFEAVAKQRTTEIVTGSETIRQAYLVEQKAAEEKAAAAAGAGVKVVKGSKEAAAAAKAAANEYTNLLTKVKEQIAANVLLINGYDKLTPSQKLTIDLDAAIATGKSKISGEDVKLIRNQIEIAKVQEGVIETQKKAAQGLEDYNKIAKAYTDESDKAIKNAEEEASKNEEMVKTFGMTKGAIEDLELARMKQRLEQRAAIGMTLDEVTALEKLIAAQERNTTARNTLDTLEAEKKANAEKLKDWNESVKKYDDIFSKGFADMVNNGKGAWKSFTKSLVTTFKTSVADQIYKMFAQPFVVKLIGSVLGVMGGSAVSGVANAATGGTGDVLSVIGNIKTAYSAITNGFSSMGSSIASGVAKGMQVAGMGTPATSGMGVMGAESMSGATTAAGSLQGTAFAQSVGVASAYATSVVIGKTIAEAISGGYKINHGNALNNIGSLGGVIGGTISGLINRTFGMAEKKTTTQGIEGSFGADGFAGNTYKNWKQKGGLLRSDKSGTEIGDVDTSTVNAFTSGFSAIKTASSSFAKALGLDASSVAGYSEKIKLNITKDAKENEATIAGMFSDIGTRIANQLVPGIDRFGKTGETSSVTLERLATSLTAANGMFDTLNMKLYDATLAGGDMASQLVDLFGDMKKMQELSASYFANYFSGQEKASIGARQLGATFAELGYVMPSTKEELRNMIEALNLTTEAGRKSYAELIGLSGAFSQLSDAAKEATTNMLDSAMAILQASVGREKDAAQAAYDAQIAIINAQKSSAEEVFNITKDALTETMNAATASNTAFKALASSLKSTLDGMYLVTQQAMRRQSAQEMIAAALDVARSTGVLPTAESLNESLKTVSQPSENLFATFEDYATDFGVTAGQIADLNDLTNSAVKKSDTAIDLAKMQLDLLETQHKAAMASFADAEKAAKDFYDREIARLDSILTNAQEQLEVAKGTNIAIKSLEDALAGFAAAIAATKAPAPVVSGGGGGGGALSSGGSSTALRDSLTDYAAKNGNDAYFFTPGINDYAAKLEVNQQIANATGMSVSDVFLLGGQSQAYWQDMQAQFDAGLAPTTSSPMLNGTHAAGLNEVPFDNYTANLHAGERVLTSRQAAEADTTAEEIRMMREELKAALGAIASNTGKQARLAQKWDGDGLPAVRDVSVV